MCHTPERSASILKFDFESGEVKMSGARRCNVDQGEALQIVFMDVASDGESDAGSDDEWYPGEEQPAVQDAAFEPVADDVENFEVDAAVHEEEQDDGAEEDAADVSYQKVHFRLIYT